MIDFKALFPTNLILWALIADRRTVKILAGLAVKLGMGKTTLNPPVDLFCFHWKTSISLEMTSKLIFRGVLDRLAL